MNGAHRLLGADDCRGVGIVCRVVDFDRFSSCEGETINNARCCGNEIEIILAFESLLYNLHVQKTEESATETESESNRRFGFEFE